ncbi:hypothetical protein VM98_01785 [Streptomyces rubellomurinus subsp. indigoferus]|nr:hypothetical protein VM98_01785 [Streptomyces rubellomurinus subsp. indigoferus]
MAPELNGCGQSAQHIGGLIQGQASKLTDPCDAKDLHIDPSRVCWDSDSKALPYFGRIIAGEPVWRAPS